MKVIIDRFEGEFAVVELEEGNLINIPKVLVNDCKEGDVININKDEDETIRREDKVDGLMSKLFKD